MTRINLYLQMEIEKLQKHLEALKHRLETEKENQKLQEEYWQTEDMIELYKQDMEACL